MSDDDLIKNLNSNISSLNKSINSLIQQVSSLTLELQNQGPNQRQNQGGQVGPVDRAGRVIKVGDFVRSIDPPLHNGRVKKISRDWVFISTGALRLKRKKPNNVTVQQ